MSDIAFEKLTTMWRSGEINDDEFKLAAQYLREEQANAGASSGRDRQAADRSPTASPSLAAQLARLLMPRAVLESLAPWQRHLVEVALFVALAGIGVWLVGQLVLAALIADIEGSWNLNPLGAAGLTFLVLATGGMLVGYNRRILGVVSVPLFLLLLFAPLWKSPDDQGSSSQVRSFTAYERPLYAADYGAGWPFLGYSHGTLRCERRTVSGVTRSLVTVEFGGKIYGLNGASTGWGGYDDSRRLMAEHPQWGTYELGATGEMIDDALVRCG
jgi:hypothetical protein